MSKLLYDTNYQCGFDLTNISARAFFKLLTINKLQWTQRKLGSGAYVWGFKEGYIVTGNCPLTGNYARPELRDHEIGYASYIGVQGTKAFRDRVAKFIRHNATQIKEYDKNRRSWL
jgi:hypothetical protein